MDSSWEAARATATRNLTLHFRLDPDAEVVRGVPFRDPNEDAERVLPRRQAGIDERSVQGTA
ncbi:MAG: hypothetical protein H0X71_08950 [Rubrobacter sp.]|nr:hypothetical protein [Rubrobacter sp.]